MLQHFFLPTAMEEHCVRRPVVSAKWHYMPHYKNYNGVLCHQFEDRIISWSGHIPWQPHAQYLAPADFFLLRFVKSVVYKTPPEGKHHCNHQRY
jgi:hypothetical protein